VNYGRRRKWLKDDLPANERVRAAGLARVIARSGSVTGKVYNNHSKRMKVKRAVLDGVAAELRRIISEPATAQRLAA
jgi:hypothetical protein